MAPDVGLLAGIDRSIVALLPVLISLALVSCVVRPRRVSAGAAARLDRWKILGPGGGGTIVACAVSPHDPDLILAASEMSGTYISRDAGSSWRMINLGQVVYSFAFHPVNPDIIYAGGILLYKSDDCGKTWTYVYPSPKARTEFFFQGDHAYNLIFTEDPSYPSNVERVFVTSIALHASDPRFIFIAHRGSIRYTAPSAALVTRDAGDTWEVIRILDREIVTASAVDPETSVVTFASESAVYSWDGRDIERRPAPIPRLNGVSFGHVNGRLVIYATREIEWRGDAMSNAVIVSGDEGRTWTDATGTLADELDKRNRRKLPQFDAIACCLARAEVVYAGFRNFPLGSGKDDVYNGVARSADGGRTWRVVRRERRLAALDSEEGYNRRRLPAGNIWFDEPDHITVAPSDPNVCLASDLFRTLITRDGGRSWASADYELLQNGVFITRGLDMQVCFGVRFNPRDPDTMYSLYGNLGIWKSSDSGKSWLPLSDGIPLEWRRASYWLEFDPEVPGTMWAAVSGTHDLPRPKMWRRRSISTYRGGVVFTADGGRTWTPAQCPTSAMAVTHVIVDPRSPAGNRTLYACGFGRGVLKSTDNGKTWTFCNTGLRFEEPFVWRLSMAGERSIYAVIARRHEWGESNPAGQGTLYRSTDAASTWREVPLPDGVDGPMCITPDQRDPETLYLAAWGRYTSHEDVGGGVYVTRDACRSWEKTPLDDLHIYDVTFDPRSNVLYAAGFESGVYRSDDGASTWTRIRGCNFRWNHRVTPDPADPGMIFVATFGGGIWYGPATGDAAALEDLVTPLHKGGRPL